MTASQVADAVDELRRQLGLTVDPGRRGPIQLEAFFEEMSRPRLVHYALPGLTRKRVFEHLRSLGLCVPDPEDPEQSLAGFVFRSGNVGCVYVSADRNNPLGRQRFTAAHELGHIVLHGDAMPEQYLADTEAIFRDPQTIAEPKEREANQFAAELLIPEAVCYAREKEFRRQFGCCPRLVLAYHLAAELLVSREAVRYRLHNLKVGDE